MCSGRRLFGNSIVCNGKSGSLVGSGGSGENGERVMFFCMDGFLVGGGKIFVGVV